MVFNETGRKGTGSFGLTWVKIVHILWRFLQIIMACVVIGYYAKDLRAAHKVDKYADSKWVFAVVVGSLSAVTALVFAIIGVFAEYRTIAMGFPWEWILVILWAAVSGVFGSMYTNEHPEMDKGVKRMKAAANCNYANLCFWVVTAAVGTYVFFRSGRRSLHTGRATL